MLMAEASARESAWALATRARCCTLAYSGMAMAARMPMMATTIINSMSVKPRWLPSIARFLCQKLIISVFPLAGVGHRSDPSIEFDCSGPEELQVRCQPGFVPACQAPDGFLK